MLKPTGFSLLEILITLSIAAIITAFSLGGFQSLFNKATEDIASKQLMRAITLARNDAIILGQTITLCKSTNQKTCGGDWSDGYIVLSNNKLLFSFKNNTGQLYWRAFPYFLDDLNFLSSGFANFQNGTFWYCLKNAAHPAWAIMLGQSGRARILYPNAQDVIIDEKGDPLDC